MFFKAASTLTAIAANSVVGSANLVSGSKADGLDIAWGFGISSYQTEGSWNVDGKGESIWDKWWHDPERARQNGNISGDVAIDHYARYKEDLKYISEFKSTAFRFSVSWARILPDCSGKVNDLAIKFYSDYIDRVIAEGALPLLTLYHW